MLPFQLAFARVCLGFILIHNPRPVRNEKYSVRPALKQPMNVRSVILMQFSIRWTVHALVKKISLKPQMPPSVSVDHNVVLTCSVMMFAPLNETFMSAGMTIALA